MFISDVFAQEKPTEGTTATVEVTTPQDATAAPYELSQEKMFKDTLVFLALLFMIFYFMLIRPQQKKFKAHKELLGGLQKGDEIITGGGLIGRIHKFDGDHIVIVEVAENLRVKIARSSISGRYFEPEAVVSKKSAAIAAPKNTANDN